MDRHGWGADITGAVHGELVAECGPPLAELVRSFQQFRLFLRRCHLSLFAVQAPDALTHFAMVVGEKHPLHPLHANLWEMLQRDAVPEIDEHCSVPVAQRIHIARILPEEDLRPRIRRRLHPAGGCHHRGGFVCSEGQAGAEEQEGKEWFHEVTGSV